MVTRDKQPTEIAYAAGLLDGEGSITLTNHLSSTFQVMVVITNTNLEALYWMKDHFGGRVYEGRTRAAQWRLERREDQEWFLELLLPYLIVKKQQARIALAYRTLVIPGQGGDARNSELRWLLYYLIQAINGGSGGKSDLGRAVATTEREKIDAAIENVLTQIGQATV